ncbi:MAG TPA: hypothetical protein VFS90_09435 [Pyrinomonadaceae bacterium]|nr:hypothetical protein [Pyrinomonadaceae bacterium]
MFDPQVYGAASEIAPIAACGCGCGCSGGAGGGGGSGSGRE